MNKLLALFLSMIGLLSCNPSKNEILKLDIANQYYIYLNSSDENGMRSIIGDSITIREKEDNYEEVFSKDGYINWLKWDSVFDPTYKILEIEQVDKTVKSKLSKIDNRISFLHEEPMVWSEIIQFGNDKIVKIERVKYEVFDVPKFLRNRKALVSWVKENQPELDGFINNQTADGGLMYLEAIDLYKKRK